jgi:tRNA (cytidine/uridine-2'-O-)-methyltransferase
MKRAGLDYLPHAAVVRHDSWRAFQASRKGRLILATTKACQSYAEFRYVADDTLLFGREGAGVTQEVAAAADAHIVIPMKPATRSLNVAVSAAMILGEALRQTSQLPEGIQP